MWRSRRRPSASPSCGRDDFGIGVRRKALFFVEVHLHTGEVLGVTDIPPGNGWTGTSVRQGVGQEPNAWARECGLSRFEEIDLRVRSTELRGLDRLEPGAGVEPATY
jgi:hypothetical protein